jgi:SNF2 family DNA or RNA helicase
MVEIEIVNGKIWAKIPYMNGRGPTLAKTIAGARPKYDNSGDKRQFLAWVYPLDMSVCRRFREVFGQDLRIGVDLAAWARKEIAAEASQLQLRSATDASLERVPALAPALADAMSSRTYQRVGARFAVDGKTVLIADEPGTGKTLETLAALVESGSKTVLVFCKKKAIETVWAAEVPRWLGTIAKVYPVIGSASQRRDVLKEFRDDFRTGAEAMQVVVGNIEMVRRVKVEQFCKDCKIGYLRRLDGESTRTYDARNFRAQEHAIKLCPNKANHKHLEEAKFPEIFGTVWDAIVVDESHKALIGKNTMSKGITQTRLGMMRLQLAEGGMKIALSGTPARGKPENIWGTLNWLRPDVFTSYWRFVESYFKTTEGYGNSKVIVGIDPAHEADYDRTLAKYMIRRTKEEVAPDMPSRQYGGTPLDPADPASTIGVWLDLEPAQAKRYEQIRDDGILSFDDDALFIDGVLPELTRRKQYAICDWTLVPKIVKGEEVCDLVPANPANSNKYAWLKEFIEERAESGQKVVVASQFTKVVDAFSAWLRADGIESYTLTGATSDRAATANVAAFNDPSDPVMVFLLNTYAGGESINLDACADDIVFLDETFIPDDQEQVENRIHRMSRIHQVNVWYVRSKGTVEEQICRTTGARKSVMKGRLDGSRGIEAMRRLIEDDGANKSFKAARKASR